VIEIDKIGPGLWVQMKRFRGPSYRKLKEWNISIDCSDDGEMLWLFRDGIHRANVWSDIMEQPHWVVSEPTLHTNVTTAFPMFFDKVDEDHVVGTRTFPHGYIVTEYEHGGGMIGLKRSLDAGMEMFISKTIYDVPYLVTDKATIHEAVIKRFPELFEEVE
jgi:hypothetical protein